MGDPVVLKCPQRFMDCRSRMQGVRSNFLTDIGFSIWGFGPLSLAVRDLFREITRFFGCRRDRRERHVRYGVDADFCQVSEFVR
jgi:hypothetical protein